MRASSETSPEYTTAPKYNAASQPNSRDVRAGRALRSAKDAAAAMADLADAPQEHFVVFDLDVRHRILERRVVGIGSVSGVDTHPREVFRGALINNASAVLLAHNHPSGNPEPSRQDIELTARLRECGTLLGIVVLDHVIVAGDGWTSLADRCWQ